MPRIWRVEGVSREETVVHRKERPVRKCHKCPLNQGTHCWGFVDPRQRWHRRGRCPAFENEEAYSSFRTWQKEAIVKTRRQLRQEAFRAEDTTQHCGYLEKKTDGKSHV